MLKKITIIAAGLGLCLGTATAVNAGSVQEDIERFQNFYVKKFPNTPKEDFVNGVYSIDAVGRENWEAIEEFPPYEPAIEEGEAMWNTPFANGKGYKDCFPDGPAQRKNYPHWDKERKMVVTLPLAINECREANGEKPLKYKKGDIATLLAYMAYESRGQTIDVKVPEDDPDALAAFEAGKQFWFARRGQLNFACAHCHAYYPGQNIRAEVLSPAFGHASHWPVYRSKWGELGTLHRRFTGCNKQVRAKPFKAQGEEYRNLEYFLTAMSSGLKFNGPGARK
jgi:sulfur-oxidizing protein SoxA